LKLIACNLRIFEFVKVKKVWRSRIFSNLALPAVVEHKKSFPELIGKGLLTQYEDNLGSKKAP